MRIRAITLFVAALALGALALEAANNTYGIVKGANGTWAIVECYTAGNVKAACVEHWVLGSGSQDPASGFGADGDLFWRTDLKAFRTKTVGVWGAATIGADVGASLAAGVTVSGTAETILFKLDGDSAATQTFLSFTNVADPLRTVVLSGNTTTPNFRIRVQDDVGAFTEFGQLEVEENGVILTGGDTGSAGTGQIEVQGSNGTITNQNAANVSYNFQLTDNNAQAFFTFTNVATPANVITMAQDSSVPSLTTTVTDGTASGTVLQNLTSIIASSTNGTAFGAAGPSANGRWEASASNGVGNLVQLQALSATPAWSATVTDGVTTQTSALDLNGLLPPTKLFANLGTPANGYILYCSDCAIAAVCVGAGTGALAKRLGGVWVCN